MESQARSRATPLARALSRLVGWASDRRVPTPLRAPLYRAYARGTGADLSEIELALSAYPSLGAFFVRRLVRGAREIERDPAVLVSPVDGRVQAVGKVERGSLLQAKGRSYSVAELLGPAAAGFACESGTAWTIYLSPRDYHRIHAPETCRVEEAHWIPGARYSVAPKVLARRPVLAINERVVMRLATARGPLALVLVGALNVGRIRVVGIDPSRSGRIVPPPSFERGAELARFEMGSTIVLIEPSGRAEPVEGIEPGAPVRLGRAIGRFGDRS